MPNASSFGYYNVYGSQIHWGRVEFGRHLTPFFSFLPVDSEKNFFKGGGVLGIMPFYYIFPGEN